jgi:dihydroxyacetone kinase-like predicted kinase
VLPSTTIGEGYYGIGYIDRDNPNVDEIIASVTEIMQSVVTGMVSTAIRDAEGEQVTVHTGDFVGYSGKQLLSDSPDRETATKALVERLGAASRDVMLVFYGESVPAEEAERLVADLQSQYKNLEIMLNNGQQPVYDYIFVLC